MGWGSAVGRHVFLGALDARLVLLRDRLEELVDGVLPPHEFLRLPRGSLFARLDLLHGELGRCQFLEQAVGEGRVPEAETRAVVAGGVVAAQELLPRVLRYEPQELRASLRVRRPRVVVVGRDEPPGRRSDGRDHDVHGSLPHARSVPSASRPFACVFGPGRRTLVRREERARRRRTRGSVDVTDQPRSREVGHLRHLLHPSHGLGEVRILLRGRRRGCLSGPAPGRHRRCRRVPRGASDDLDTSPTRGPTPRRVQRERYLGSGSAVMAVFQRLENKVASEKISSSVCSAHGS